MVLELAGRARLHGTESVLHRNIRKSYPLSFKLKFVKRFVVGGNLKDLAAECNIKKTVGKNWLMKYSEGGSEALISDRRGKKCQAEDQKVERQGNWKGKELIHQLS